MMLLGPFLLEVGPVRDGSAESMNRIVCADRVVSR